MGLFGYVISNSPVFFDKYQIVIYNVWRKDVNKICEWVRRSI